jgi:hypothetical protein
LAKWIALQLIGSVPVAERRRDADGSTGAPAGGGEEGNGTTSVLGKKRSAQEIEAADIVIDLLP